MIESLSIRNYRVLRQVSVDLKPLTVIVGPNNSGKSSVLQAIEILFHQYRRDLAVPGRELHEQPVISAVVDGIKYQCDCLPSFGRSDRSSPDLRVILLDLEPRKLATPSYPKDLALDLPADGDSLPSLLACLKLERPDRFTQIVEHMKSIVPSLLDIRVRRIRLEPDKIGDEILFDMVGAKGISAKAAGHGTLLALGVLAALSGYSGRQVVLIEELGRGLHPRAVAAFVQQLRQFQDTQLQIIGTSYSPYLLDCLAGDEALLTSLGEDGYADVRPLTAHPQYDQWRTLMAPGEFWNSVGEVWVSKATQKDRW